MARKGHKGGFARKSKPGGHERVGFEMHKGKRK